MIIIYIRYHLTIKKINLRFSYTFITFGIKIHVVYIVTSTTLSLPGTSIHNCCCRRHHHLVGGFFFFSFLMLLSRPLRLLVCYRFFFHFSSRCSFSLFFLFCFHVFLPFFFSSRYHFYQFLVLCPVLFPFPRRFPCPFFSSSLYHFCRSLVS